MRIVLLVRLELGRTAVRRELRAISGAVGDGGVGWRGSRAGELFRVPGGGPVPALLREQHALRVAGLSVRAGGVRRARGQGGVPVQSFVRLPGWAVPVMPPRAVPPTGG